MISAAMTAGTSNQHSIGSETASNVSTTLAVKQFPSSSGQHPVSFETVSQLTHFLQTQIFFFYEFFDRDKDVLCLAGTNKATNHTIELLHGTGGKFYFGAKCVFGLCRRQSLNMVAASCRLWNKIEFIDNCQAETSNLLEFCVTSVQRASLLAGAPRKYFLATINIPEFRDVSYCLIESLHLRICLIYDRSGVMTLFEDFYSMYDEDDFLLDDYQGIAIPEACSCEPLLIPSDSPMEAQHLNAIQGRPIFLIAIWKTDCTAVTALPRYTERLPCLTNVRRKLDTA